MDSGGLVVCRKALLSLRQNTYSGSSLEGMIVEISAALLFQVGEMVVAKKCIHLDLRPRCESEGKSKTPSRMEALPSPDHLHSFHRLEV
jgi:hypothetical protein